VNSPWKSVARAFLLAAVLAWAATPVAAQNNSVEKLLPDNTEMVLTVNVKGLLESAIVKKHAMEQFDQMMQQNQQVMGLMKAMNFDPRKDLTSFTFAASNIKLEVAPGQQPNGDAEPFIIVKGNFDLEKVKAGLSAIFAAASGDKKVKVSEYGTYAIYETQEGNKPMFGVFLDKETAVIADGKDKVTAAIDRAEGKKYSKMGESFKSLFSKADQKKTIWMAMLMPGSLKEQARNMPQGGEQIEKLDGMTMAVNVTEMLVLDFNMFTTDVATAQQIKQGIDQAKVFLGGMLEIQVPDQELGKQLADVVSNIAVGERDKQVSIKAEIKGDLIEKLIKMAQRGG
jgi:hypothetical protein